MTPRQSTYNWSAFMSALSSIRFIFVKCFLVAFIPHTCSQLAEELYKAMTKKFKQSWQIWLRYAQFHLKSLYSIEGARKVLERALQALPKSKRTSLGLTNKLYQCN